MSVIPVWGLISRINGFVDRAIGADDLSPHVRDKLLRQQLGSVTQMAPAVLAASLAVSAVFLALTWQTAQFWSILAATSIIIAIGLHGSYLAFVHPRKQAEGPPRNAVIRTIIYAMALGALWGFILNVLPLGQDPAIRSAATVGTGGLLCISMMALMVYPQALAAFSVPLIVGALSMVPGLDSTREIWMYGTLLTVFTFVMVVISLNHAAGFVAHRASETQLKERGEIIGLLLREFEQSKSDWIWGFDADGAINRMSAGFTTATGVAEEALVGADFVHFLRCITPPNDPLMAHLEQDVLEQQTFQDIELQVTADGRECWWSLTGKPAFDEGGNYLGYIGTGSDVTERKLAERRITMLAHHDPMTGLLNRTKFTEQLNSCVARLERYGTPFSVMFLDLDQFKSVNDSRGHMAGDRLLTQVARRIQGLVRENDLVARLGGDEFAVILPNDCNVDSVGPLAARMIEEIKQVYVIDDEQINIGVSIGIAMAPMNGTRPDQILRNADLALYRAKADGRSVYRFFESQMDSEARERRLLEVELRDAIKNNELVLYYQPLVSAEDARPTGFEALVRWNHPIRGLVAPAEFIPIAEQSNLIVDIGDWTIEQACLAAVNWPEHLTVAVNLSAKHFRRSDISVVVKRALAMSGLAAPRLEIEITEGLLMENPEAVVEKLGEIRALGVTIAMDDFGTGYSSLSYLLKFPFDKIKIDRSFVDASSDDEVARDILKAIASLGKTLKLKITAEGVETQAQAEFLSGIACHQLQGFYFARPLDHIDLPHYLLTHVLPQAPALKAEAEAKLAALAG
ncbi:putative bifunctional diguanylate cyclase/phosphodiesterase [Devosia ginsengisoli]|uniref:EAL domain-containing protein n=1 Tax=Devosia ginsengisoli TaxID=400770 RepID=A0A5B8LTS7_9HYPH|nr:GGDEF and EAL domain-containing protein [Devosia ginsengisoli]QDZ11215.1 EAL domain-containing protein [Devosia ginsengisoli]